MNRLKNFLNLFLITSIKTPYKRNGSIDIKVFDKILDYQIKME